MTHHKSMRARQILALGLPGTGKTTKIKQLLERSLAKRIEFHRADFSNQHFVFAHRVHIYDPRGEFDELVGMPVHTFKDEKSFRYPFLRYRHAEDAVHYAREYGGILVIEELMTVDKEDFYAIRQASVGRRHDDEGQAMPIIIYGATQRPVWIPREILDLSDEIYIFRLMSKKDISHVDHLLTHEQAANLKHLQVGQNYHIILNH